MADMHSLYDQFIRCGKARSSPAFNLGVDVATGVTDKKGRARWDFGAQITKKV
jgi:hypothetical protein